jgi:hypothetical protein
MTQLYWAEAEVLLQHVCVGILDAAPSSPLGKKLSSHQIDHVAAAEDCLAQRFKCALAGRIVMPVEPRGESSSLQGVIDGLRETHAVLGTMRQKHMVRAARELMDPPIADHPQNSLAGRAKRGDGNLC